MTVIVADRHNLSAYDAAYLELALRLRVPLYTNDQQLSSAAQACGYHCDGNRWMLVPD